MAKKNEKFKKNKFSFLIFFYLNLILLLGLTLLVQKVIFKNQAAEIDSPPKKVMVSNIESQGFTVSWLTEKKTTGYVLYSTSKEAIEKRTGDYKTGLDSRGPATASLVHYVNLENLNPGQVYYFAIKSGTGVYYQRLDASWQKDGLAAEQKTATWIGFNPRKPISGKNTEGAYSLEPGAWKPCSDGTAEGKISPCFRPNLIWGQTSDQYRQPIKEAVIFAEIPGKSSLLSGLANSQGKWVINLANLLNLNLKEYLAYDPGVDLLRLRAEDGEGKTASLYQLIPTVFSLDCFNLDPQECSTPPSDKTNPVNLILRLLPPTVTATPTAKPERTILPSPTPTPATSLELKVKLPATEKYPEELTAEITLQSSESATPKIKQTLALSTSGEGNFQGKLLPIPVGIFDLRLKETFSLSREIKKIEIIPGNNSRDLSNSPLIRGDLNNDDRIDVLDLGILVNQFRNEEKPNNPADLNFDGQVNGLDLAILLTNYRQSGPSGL